MIATTLLALALTFAGDAKEQAPKNYQLDLQGTSKEVQAGKPGKLELKIKAAPGYHVSAEAPLKIALAAEGLKLDKSALGHDDAKDKKSEAPEFSVGFSAAEKGDKSIAIDAVFFVCSEKICERKTEKLSVPIAVRP